jgi:hypothetical protein
MYTLNRGLIVIQITAYLRNEEDLAKWRALENKSEFLHQALSGVKENTKKPHVIKPMPVTKLPKSARVSLEELKDKINAVCTGHDTKRWDCGRKGCQYA